MPHWYCSWCKFTNREANPSCFGCGRPREEVDQSIDATPIVPKAALDRQVGGDHYKDMAIQPVEYIHRNGIGFCEGAIIKYVSRWRKKNGVEDLKKARHFLDLLIEMETKNTP